LNFEIFGISLTIFSIDFPYLDLILKKVKEYILGPKVPNMIKLVALEVAIQLFGIVAVKSEQISIAIAEHQQ
jgi:hypothetical protein